MGYKIPELPSLLRNTRWAFDPSQGTIVTEFQSGHGFTTSGADGTSNVNDTTAGLFVTGSQCATFVSAGTGASAILQNTSITSTDTTNLQPVIVLKCDDITHLASIDFSMGVGGFANEYHIQFASQVNLASGQWIVVSLSLGDAVSQGSPTRTGITAIRMFFKDDNTGNKVTVHYQGIYWMPNTAHQAGAPFPNGVASICFDDGFATAWATAKPYLDNHSLRASAYLIKDVLGGSGRITLTQAQSLQDQSGWEVNAHAYTDADHSTTMTGLTAAQLLWDMSSEKEWLFNNNLNGQGYAYPKGAANPAVVSVAHQFYRYGRGTQQLTETYPPGDPYRLKAWSAISEYTAGVAPSLVSQASGDIDRAVTNGSWLILTFHNVIPAVTSVTMASNTATIVFAGALPTTSTWQAGQTIILAGFTPSGLNGTFTIASVVNSTTITVNIGSNPGNSTVQGTAVTATTDCSYPGFTAIIDKLVSSGIAVLPVAEVFTGGQPVTPSFPLAIAQGGTGQATAAAAFNALSPMTTLGDIEYENSTPAAARLAGPTSGTAAYVLTSTPSGGAAQAPAWSAFLDATATDIQAASTQAPSAGNKGQAADAKHAHPSFLFQPSDHSLISWAYEPAVSVSTSSPLTPAGTLFLVRLHMPVAQNVTNIELWLTTAGATLTSGQCFAALYQGGSLLGTTADQSTNWASSGKQTMAISGGAVAVAAADVYVGLWYNGTTGPAPLRANSSGAVNYKLATASARWVTANTGLTTSAPGTLGAFSSLSTAYWAGLS